MVARTNPMRWSSRGKSDRAAGRPFEILMVMKFGQITKDPCKIRCVAVSLALALLAGCEGDPATFAATAADAHSSALSAPPKTSPDTNQTRTILKMEVVQISGG